MVTSFSHPTASRLYGAKRLSVNPDRTGCGCRIGRPQPCPGDFFDFDSRSHGSIQRQEAAADREWCARGGHLCFHLRSVSKRPTDQECCCRRSETPCDAHRGHSLLCGIDVRSTGRQRFYASARSRDARSDGRLTKYPSTPAIDAEAFDRSDAHRPFRSMNQSHPIRGGTCCSASEMASPRRYPSQE